MGMKHALSLVKSQESKIVKKIVKLIQNIHKYISLKFVLGCIGTNITTCNNCRTKANNICCNLAHDIGYKQ
jgi:hypothetical protein